MQVKIATETFERLFGPLTGKSDEQIIGLLTPAIEACFSNAAGIAIAQSRGCQLNYLDVSCNPFCDLGSWRALCDIAQESTGVMTSDTQCLSLSLPFSQGPIDTLKACAPAFDIPPDAYADTVNALLLLSYAMDRLAAEHDQSKIKPVIRGLEDDLNALRDEISFPGMGGIIDTPESLGNTEVWGHSQNRPASIPVFVLLQ